MPKFTPDSDTLKYVMLAVVIIIAFVLALSSLVSFLSMRKGNIKSAILAIGKYTKIQNLAPFTSAVLALIGLFLGAKKQGVDVNKGAIVFIVVTYFASIFTTAFSAKGLKAYRKDQESFSYISISSFIVVIALLLFGVGAAVAMSKIPGIEGSHVVGYLEVFSIAFTLTDLLSYLALGISARYAEKYAPKTTIADADSNILSNINSKLDNISSEKPQMKVDPVEELRRYKALLDEGVITPEEFEDKKKQILK